MNVAVSFSLAMFVAVKARGIEAPERKAIYRALWHSFLSRPLSFFLPVGIEPKSAVPEEGRSAKAV